MLLYINSVHLIISDIFIFQIQEHDIEVKRVLDVFTAVSKLYAGLKHRLFNIFTLFQNVSLPDILPRIEQMSPSPKAIYFFFSNGEERDFQFTRRGEIW